MKKTVVIIAALLAMTTSFAARKVQKQVVFSTSIHCKNCAKKVQENISFEKGVKDLGISLENKTVTVAFDPARTDTSKLASAIRKLGYNVKVIDYKDL